jgi:hypothetical protein
MTKRLPISEVDAPPDELGTEAPLHSRLPRFPESIHETNALPRGWKEAIYRMLIPSQLLIRFGIHPIRLTNRDDQRMVHFTSEPGTSAFQLQVRHVDGAEDPLFLLDLQDSSQGHITVAFMATNNPDSLRFNIDRDADGHSTLLGTARRNLMEEIRAMGAGLTPGQVRHGLRLLPHVMSRVEAFLVTIGQDVVLAEPLAYHNAIMFERHGFVYIQGQQDMERIHRGFQPGGELAARLDGSTPFRAREAGASVRGRSWAIHDSILDEPWGDVKMIRRLGPGSSVDTAPGVPW